MLDDEFRLDMKWEGVVIEKEAEDFFGRGNGIFVTSHLGAFVEKGLEEDFLPHVDFSPHVGDDDNILEVKDTGKRATPFISDRGKYFRVRTSFFIVLKQSLSFAYEVAKKAAIVLRTSVSLRMVPSNPGVSIRLTL